MEEVKKEIQRFEFKKLQKVEIQIRKKKLMRGLAKIFYAGLKIAYIRIMIDEDTNSYYVLMPQILRGNVVWFNHQDDKDKLSELLLNEYHTIFAKEGYSNVPESDLSEVI